MLNRLLKKTPYANSASSKKAPNMEAEKPPCTAVHPLYSQVWEHLPPPPLPPRREIRTPEPEAYTAALTHQTTGRLKIT